MGWGREGPSRSLSGDARFGHNETVVKDPEVGRGRSHVPGFRSVLRVIPQNQIPAAPPHGFNSVEFVRAQVASRR